jgi:acetyl esterase/lipase
MRIAYSQAVAAKPPSRGRLLLDVFARPQHRHSYGSHRLQAADLYVPPRGAPWPVAILVHGGSWRAKYGRWVLRLVAADLVRRGFAVWNVGYRRLGRGEGGGWPATFDDVAAAVDSLAGVAAERGDLDLEDVALVGHSAGGQLALWAASRSDSAVAIARVVALAAVCDMSKAQIARDVLGGSPAEVPARYDAIDPIRLVPLPMPVLLVHGAQDRTVPVQRSREYAAAARAAGGDVELVEPPDTGHRAFVDPRSEGWRIAAEWILPAWSSTASPSTRSGRSST